MTWRIVLNWVWPPALLIAFAVAIPWLLVDDWTKQIATFAAVVSVGGFLINYAKFVHDVAEKKRDREKKEEEKRVRLVLVPRHRQYDAMWPNLGVQVHNAGAAPVGVQNVRLAFTSPDGTKQFTMLTRCEDLPGKEKTQGVATLGSKQTIEFFVPCGTQGLRLPALLELPDDALWIAVGTFDGVEVRLPGEQIKNLLLTLPKHVLR